MEISQKIKTKIEQVVNVFETGSIEGDYGNVSVYSDGKDRAGNQTIYQVTYGRSQTTEQGNLKKLLDSYIAKSGKFALALKPYMPQLNKIVGHDTVLSKSKEFKGILEEAASDPVMILCQDNFFDVEYYQRALAWATTWGFKENLSLLVIYDSFIHSGSMLTFLQNAFPEKKPKSGGNERRWIIDYVNVRHNWLKRHDNRDLRPTVYRTIAFMKCFRNENWNLSQPIQANGEVIK